MGINVNQDVQDAADYLRGQIEETTVSMVNTLLMLSQDYDADDTRILRNKYAALVSLRQSLGGAMNVLTGETSWDAVASAKDIMCALVDGLENEPMVDVRGGEANVKEGGSNGE